MASKAKVASLAVPATREEFHQYLQEMRGIAGTVAEIVDAVLDLGWGKRFLTLKPSKQKFRADLERARQVPGVEVMEQRDELFVQFPGTLREAVGGKLKKKGEEEDEAA